MKYEIESKCHNTFDSNNSICVCELYVHMLVHKIDKEPYKPAVVNKQASFQLGCDGEAHIYPCHKAGF